MGRKTCFLLHSKSFHYTLSITFDLIHCTEFNALNCMHDKNCVSCEKCHHSCTVACVICLYQVAHIMCLCARLFFFSIPLHGGIKKPFNNWSLTLHNINMVGAFISLTFNDVITKVLLPLVCLILFFCSNLPFTHWNRCSSIKAWQFRMLLCFSLPTFSFTQLRCEPLVFIR